MVTDLGARFRTLAKIWRDHLSSLNIELAVLTEEYVPNLRVQALHLTWHDKWFLLLLCFEFLAVSASFVSVAYRQNITFCIDPHRFVLRFIVLVDIEYFFVLFSFEFLRDRVHIIDVVNPAIFSFLAQTQTRVLIVDTSTHLPVCGLVMLAGQVLRLL